jgi:hypothetical protein
VWGPGLGLRSKTGSPHTGLLLPCMQLKTALCLLQFQTDYRQTAAKSAADHRFLFVDLALVISSSDVPRIVWRAASLRGEQFLSGIAILCRVLGLSRSGYYAWKKRPARQDQLALQVEEVFCQNSRRYGSRRITAELREQTVIGRHRVRRLRREQGLQAIQPRRFAPRTTDSRHGQRMSPNLLVEREIIVDRPRQVIFDAVLLKPVFILL